MVMKNIHIIEKNIYITSDEEIKEGDWVITNGGLRFVTKLNNLRDNIKSFTDDGTISKQSPSSYCRLELYKKIILTTDQDLIKDGVQFIDDEFLEWFVKNSSCDEVKVADYGNVLFDDKVFHMYKIIIPKQEQCTCKEHDPYCCQIHGSCPTCVKKEEQKQHIIDIMKADEELGLYEEPKQETLEEALERLYPENIIKLGNNTSYDAALIKRKDFTDGAKWQAEQDKNKYNKREIINLIQFLSMNQDFNSYSSVSKDTAKKFLKQFKKK
jgi:hypothetical protein